MVVFPVVVAVPVSRRAVLAAGLLVPLTGCTGRPPPQPPTRVNPDVALRAAAVAREQRLLQLYDRALAPGLRITGVTRQVLTSVRAEHATHLFTLTGPPPSPAARTAGATTVPATPTSPAASIPAVPVPAVPVPAVPPPARRQLLAAEATAAQAHGDAVTAASRPLAALLATLSAAEAAHSVALQ